MFFCFVIGEFISVTMNEPMPFCFVIGEFISVTMNEPMLFCFVIGEFISVTMNEPMLFCFVIGEFCELHTLKIHQLLPGMPGRSWCYNQSQLLEVCLEEVGNLLE